MSTVKIIPYNYKDTDNIDGVTFEQRGAGAVHTESDGSMIKGHLRVSAKDFGCHMTVLSKEPTSKVGIRRYLGTDGDVDLEALIVNAVNGIVTRCSILHLKERKPLQLVIDSEMISCLRPSQDGRYLAVGNAIGQFELWNLDEGRIRSEKLSWNGPSRIFSFAFASGASITDLCFSRSNLRLFIALSDGKTYLLDIHGENIKELSAEEVGWPCFSIDCQSEGDAVLFAGEEPILWLLDMPEPFWDTAVPRDLNPFEMSLGQTHTGASYWKLKAMPQASISCLATGVGSYIRKAVFISDNRVAVLGPVATEVWQISPEVTLLARRKHDPDSRLFDICGDEDTVRVALGG